MLLMIDNYDSFTYNLVQYFGELGEAIEVFRNDAISIAEIETLHPECLIISPGPGRPANAGICKEIGGQMLHPVGKGNGNHDSSTPPGKKFTYYKERGGAKTKGK